MYQKENVSPRPPPKISYKDNWMCELDSDVAGSSKDTQRIQPKTQLSSTERPVCGQESKTEIEKRTEFDDDTLSQEKHDDVTDSASTGRPVCGPESTKRCVLTPKHVEEDQRGTGRPVLVDQKEEHEIDFRVPQDCHMQLWKKQNISEFKSLRTRSKTIFIEKQFMPTCSRMTPTTHSAKKRRTCPELRDQERTYSWCSTWQDRRTNRVPCGLECMDEILKVNITKVFTIVVSKIKSIVIRNSKLAGPSKSA